MVSLEQLYINMIQCFINILTSLNVTLFQKLYKVIFWKKYKHIMIVIVSTKYLLLNLVKFSEFLKQLLNKFAYKYSLLCVH